MTEPYWAVAAIQTSREDFVQQMLKREAYETYGPRIRVAPKRTASLFPGYLMVKVLVRWYPIRWCPGVLRLLMNGDRPARLPDAVVAEIRSREVRGFVKLPKDPQALEPGQAVRVKAGSFIGFKAVFQGMTSQQRERVLLDLLGQAVVVTMPPGSVEAIA